MAFRRGHPDATRRSRIARDEARQVRVGAEDGAARTELWGTHAAIAETNGLGSAASDWKIRVLNVCGTTISGGSTEISRNIIGERTFGLSKST